MKISELAKATNVSAKTIRYYEQVNLLLPAKRSESGYRHYDKKDIATLVFIRRCRELNIPIIDIKRLLDVQKNPNASCAFIDEMIQNQLIRIQEAQKELALLAIKPCWPKAACPMTPPPTCAGSTPCWFDEGGRAMPTAFHPPPSRRCANLRRRPARRAGQIARAASAHSDCNHRRGPGTRHRHTPTCARHHFQ